jgi:hypothetical protein
VVGDDPGFQIELKLRETKLKETDSLANGSDCVDSGISGWSTPT